MSGPEPAVAEIRRAVRGQLTTGPVVVACSGGADSLALAAATAFEARRRGVGFGLVTVDHGLRAGSAARAATVAELAFQLGFDPVWTVPVGVGARGGPQAAARTARYRALEAVAVGWGAVVLLGHTLDDQAETVLLGLGRGSGPRSIAGMQARSGIWVRPLLGVRRATTRAACTALALPVWDDPANTDRSYQRVRLRHEVLPLLEDTLQGGVTQSLARTAALLRDDLDALDSLAAAQWTQLSSSCSGAGAAPESLPVEDLERLPRAVRTRVLRLWALGLGAPELGAVHVAALEALVSDWHGQGPIELPGGRSVRRSSARLHA